MSGRRARRLRHTAALIALMVALAPTGCQLRSEPETITRLTWWVTYAEDSEAYAALEAIAQGYAASRENVEVELVAVPWESVAPRLVGTSQLALAQEANEGPDLWGPVPCQWAGAYARDSQSLPLATEQIEGTWLYADVALEACQVEGQLYGLPVLMDALALIYNPSLAPDPPSTFSELIALGETLGKGDPQRWALALPLLSEYHIYPFLDGYDGFLLRCEGGACDAAEIGLNSEGAVRGIQFLSDLYVRHGLFPEDMADRAVMHERALSLFLDGDAATMIEGAWVLPQLEDAGIDYRVAPLPALPETEDAPRSLTTAQALYLSAASVEQEQTLDLVAYVAGKERLAALQQALGTLPVRRDVLTEPALRGNAVVSTWYGIANRGVPLPNMPELDLMWYPWSLALEEAIPGLTPPQDALDTAVGQIRTYLGAE
ncbi:MAG: extracellular solute-binding protein [Anaerolineae bacterium]|nr:extracellular solute-binding protein [Anaerolineae bacterium]